MNFIAGDLGGTKTILRLFSSEGETIREELYESEEHPSFDSILDRFMDGAPPVTAGCFAVAGPVLGSTATVTNLPWVLNAGDLSDAYAIPRVRLVNDFYGVAASLSGLGTADFEIINQGQIDRSFPRAVLGAGTGLGEAIVANSDGDPTIISTEGGHCDFAPADGLQDELLDHLRNKHGHVSWERVVSGPGIVAIYQFLRIREGKVETTVADASQVEQMADQGDEIAEQAFDIFIDCYGAEAGNLALKSLPRGGLYVAGGIGAKNVDRMTDGRFLTAFTSKGRFRDLLGSIPVYLIINPNAGLIGASSLARSLEP